MVNKDSFRPGYKRKHKRLVDDIAEHAGVRRDVVEDVLNGFYDIAAERLLNERKFTIKGIVSISTVITKNGIRKDPHLQYRARVSSGLRKLLGKMEDEPNLKVDRFNWRDIASKLQPTRKKSATMNLSDFLEDDEDF